MSEQTYDIEYYEHMLREYSVTAEKICKIRWDWIADVKPRYVLDYGSGVGWFRAFRPEDVEVDSYDIAVYPQTGLVATCDYDAVCFWDVLEHIPNFNSLANILKTTKYVALTLPLIDGVSDVATWKHFKPNEHLHFFTQDILVAMFNHYGFSLLKHGKPECPPREDVYSFLFKKEK
jgi:hypothetical protein